MKNYPQGLSGIFLTIPLDIPTDILAAVSTADVIVNLNRQAPRTLVFEKKKSVLTDEVTFNQTLKTVAFKLKTSDFSNLGVHDIQVFFKLGDLFIPTYRQSFRIVENNIQT